jgi:hypothetical protein
MTNEAIQEFENELAEETSLQKILDENDSSNFTAIRDALKAFQEKNGVEEKLARLQELYTNIQTIVEENDQKLRGHAEVENFVNTINSESKLSAAENIPSVIKSVRDYLLSKGRTGDNTPYTVFRTLAPRKQHSETPGKFTSMYLDGNTWLSLETWNIPNGWEHMANSEGRTLMFWIKKDMNEPVNDCGIFGWGTMSADNKGFGAVLENGELKATTGGEAGYSTFSSSLDDGLWHHVCIEQANGKIIQYLDTKKVGEHVPNSVVTSFESGNSGIYLGGAPESPTLGFGRSGGKFFKGYIAEIGIHKRHIFDLIQH